MPDRTACPPPALKVSAEEAEAYLDDALAKGVLKAPPAEAKKKK